jgi:hypothetical protein
MIGWQTIERIRRVEKEIDQLGFKFDKAKNSDWSSDQHTLAIIPKDNDSLPIYTRDAQIFVGNIEGLEDWLAGVRWAREYDMMLRLSDDEKRKRKEQDERNRQLVRLIKNEKVEKVK